MAFLNRSNSVHDRGFGEQNTFWNVSKFKTKRTKCLHSRTLFTRCPSLFRHFFVIVFVVAIVIRTFKSYSVNYSKKFKSASKSLEIAAIKVTMYHFKRTKRYILKSFYNMTLIGHIRYIYVRVGPYSEKLWPRSWKCCPRPRAAFSSPVNNLFIFSKLSNEKKNSRKKNSRTRYCDRDQTNKQNKYQYSNMATRISGQNYIFFMSLNSQKRLEYKFEYKKKTQQMETFDRLKNFFGVNLQLGW